MGKIFLQVVTTGGTSSPPTALQKIAIDPITRIEGHLRIEAKVENGVVTEAWSAATMFRGIEQILKGRDPRDAWAITQRLCGVCTTVHAIASVRAVEDALEVTVPDNARILRNLIEAVQYVQDHVIHFYHLHALDWVDIVSALAAEPAKASALQQSISTWGSNSTAYFQGIKTRLQNFVNSGQLGLFGNAYWGHPAYKLPPEGNLLAVAHYLEALDWQQQVIKLHAILGGKNPHLGTYLVGGMASPVDPSNSASITPTRIASMRSVAQQALDFVNRVYIPDLLLVASYYKDWASIGGGYGNFLSFGDFPTDNSGDPNRLWLPRGVIYNKNINSAPQPLDQNLIQEYITRSWYTYTGGDSVGIHPSQGQTTPNYNGPQPPYQYLNTDSKYSWLKAPRYNNQPMEVGPLARMLVAYAAWNARVRQLVGLVLSKLQVGPYALFSTLGRVAARGIETQLIAEQLDGWFSQLATNIQSNNLATHNSAKWNPSTWPPSATGWGTTEAPRGALGHWVSIKNGKIDNYQMVVATVWNGGQRDAAGQRGVWEQALIGTRVADATKPVEILRTIHSFDPCMACAVHLVDAENREVTRVQVEPM